MYFNKQCKLLLEAYQPATITWDDFKFYQLIEIYLYKASEVYKCLSSKGLLAAGVVVAERIVKNPNPVEKKVLELIDKHEKSINSLIPIIKELREWAKQFKPQFFDMLGMNQGQNAYVNEENPLSLYDAKVQTERLFKALVLIPKPLSEKMLDKEYVKNHKKLKASVINCVAANRAIISGSLTPYNAPTKNGEEYRKANVKYDEEFKVYKDIEMGDEAEKHFGGIFSEL